MATREEPRAARGRALGVTALLVPPVAWMLALALSYAVEDFTCSAASSADEAAPETAVRAVVLVLNGVLLLVTVLAGVAGWVAWRRARGRPGGGLQVFLGSTGAALAALLAFGIVLIAWNPLVLEVCG